MAVTHTVSLTRFVASQHFSCPHAKSAWQCVERELKRAAGGTDATSRDRVDIRRLTDWFWNKFLPKPRGLAFAPPNATKRLIRF
jgi:hypothetical protein